MIDLEINGAGLGVWGSSSLLIYVGGEGVGNSMKEGQVTTRMLLKSVVLGIAPPAMDVGSNPSPSGPSVALAWPSENKSRSIYFRPLELEHLHVQFRG